MRAEEVHLDEKPGRRIQLLSSLILGVGVALSTGSFWFVNNNISNEARLKFERQASDSHHRLEAHLSSYTDILFGLRALFHSSDLINRKQFHNYVASLDLRRFPGVLVINYAEHVRGDQKDIFETKVRKDTSLHPGGLPGFRIKPPGNRPFFHVLTYVEPISGNEIAIGRDILMQPGRRTTFDHLIKQLSSSTGLWSTGRPVVIEGLNRHWAIAMRLPIYDTKAPIDTLEQRQTALLGTLGAGFRVGDLMQNVLNEETLEWLRFKVFDTGPTRDSSSGARAPGSERLLLFDSKAPRAPVPEQEAGSGDEQAADRGMLQTMLPLSLAGRIWKIEYSAPVRTLISSGDVALPWLVLFGGILISVLLCGVAYSLGSSRSRAITLARHITRDLRESEASLAEAQQMARLGSWTLDGNSGAMEWSAETFRILKLDPNTKPSYAEFVRRIHPDDVKTVVAARDEVEYRLVFKDGSTSWVHVLIRQAFDRKEVLQGTIMDITERHQAAEELRNYAERLKSVSRRLLEVQEAERRLLASELHDRVGQSLTALGLNLSIVEKLLGAHANAALSSRLVDSSALVEQTMDSMRNVMGELRPQGLDEYGLVAPLKAFTAAFSQRTGIRVELQATSTASRLKDTAALAMFRIAQEALNNIAKHSGARRVQMALVEGNGRATLTITDDGMGFDASALERPGWGLLIMRERAEAVGARFAIDSSRGGGTRVIVEYIPKEADEKLRIEA